jgi:hypothetical protein
MFTDISYQNDAVWDVLILLPPYIVPSIGYYDASGFFADASLSYLTNQ